MVINVILNQTNSMKSKQYINDTYNINLITSLRKNSKNKLITDNNEKLLC